MGGGGAAWLGIAGDTYFFLRHKPLAALYVSIFSTIRYASGTASFQRRRAITCTAADRGSHGVSARQVVSSCPGRDHRGGANGANLCWRGISPDRPLRSVPVRMKEDVRGERRFAAVHSPELSQQTLDRNIREKEQQISVGVDGFDSGWEQGEREQYSEPEKDAKASSCESVFDGSPHLPPESSGIVSKSAVVSSPSIGPQPRDKTKVNGPTMK